uniref:Uncharacterized protein n=1 Tax=Arundo donax TaxID=35708 RepID=A0A0A9AN62_ARUDO
MVATHHPLLTKVATPTHPPTKVVAILATVVVHQATQVVKEATRTTNELVMTTSIVPIDYWKRWCVVV